MQRLFALALAVGHAPRFEADHAESLAQDWLHLPVPKDKAVLKECATLGERVGALLDPAADVTDLLTKLLGGRRQHLGVIETKAVDAARDSSSSSPSRTTARRRGSGCRAFRQRKRGNILYC